MRLTGRLLVSGGLTMQTVRYVYWQDEDGWLGYLEEYPDYWTQGDSLDDLSSSFADSKAVRERPGG